jgi:homoserine O-acetyltransferase
LEQNVLEDLTEAERKALARCRHAVLGVERPLRLDCGVELGP